MSAADTVVDGPLYLSNPFRSSRLVTGKFKAIIAQPKYADLLEWVAVNLFDFYTNVNLFLACLTDSCTNVSCPSMSASPTFSYTWTLKNGKASHLPAPTHMDFIITWIQNTIDDNNVFPTRLGAEFPKNFTSIAKNMYRQLLHLFTHIYHAHFPALLHLRVEGHWNSLFAHFLAFGQEFNLLEGNDLHDDRGENLGIGILASQWKEAGILS